MSSKIRSERWRARRRSGAIPITVEVLPSHRRALESLGLIGPGMDRDHDAVAWAVERFLGVLPGFQAMGDAIYPDMLEADEVDDGEGPEEEFETLSPASSA